MNTDDEVIAETRRVSQLIQALIGWIFWDPGAERRYEALGVPPKLKDDRMGHEDGSVQARYSHVTAEMRRRLMDDLTAVWREALVVRLGLDPRSPVPILDRLLRSETQ